MDPTMLSLLLQAFVPFASVFVVGLARRVMPAIPKVVLPLAAPVVGVGLAVLTGITDPSHGAVLGALGVFVREVVDQAQKLISPPTA